MDNLEKQKRTLNKIIGKKKKVQVYDRNTKKTNMVPRSGSTINSANSSKKKNQPSFAKNKKSAGGGCGGCSRKRKSGD